MGPFTIDKGDIRVLADELLRGLLVRLLEAEAQERGIPTSGIAAGGNQTVPDGVYVSIVWDGDPTPSG